MADKKHIANIIILIILLISFVPIKVAADLGASRLSLKAARGSFVRSAEAELLFVIKGVVTNNYATRRSFILLKGSIYNDRGYVLRSKSAYAGNTFTESEIKGMSLEEINKKLGNRYGQKNMNFNIKPESTIPFVIIFENLPENISEFTVEAVSSSSGEGTGEQRENTNQKEIEVEIKRIVAQYRERSQKEIGEQVRINSAMLNVRSGPGTTHPVIYTAKLNDIFLVLEKTGGWIKIKVDSNRNGWISEKYVEYLDIDTTVTKEIKIQTPTTSQTDFPPFNAKVMCLILLIISIIVLSIINKKLRLKNWWMLPLISIMVLAISLHSMLPDLHYELDESMKLLLVLGCLIGAIAIAYVSSSRWTFVLLLFGGLPLLALVHKVFGVWIGTILLFLIIWIYGLFIRKLDGKTKSERATIIIKHVPIIIVGLSYIVVAGWVIIQRFVAGNLVSHDILYAMWILLGITLLYKRKFAIILSLLSYPSVFALNILPQPIIGDINFLTPLLYTPFHHISFIILQKYALLSTIKPYWTAYLWGTYAIHSICLLPYLFKKRKSVHVPKKAAIKFRFPEVVDIYQKNAFQVLGLIPYRANKIRSISKRKNELSVLIKTDLRPEDHLRDYHVIPWPGAKPVTESEINNAYSRLQDSLKRIKEELFWFHLEENSLEPFKCLLKGDFDEVRRLWEGEKGNNSKTYNSALSLHNLAVLEHALVLTQERTITGNPRMSNVHIDDWKRVFALWLDVYKYDKCWDYFKQRMVYLNDPRINDRYIHRLRKDVPRLVLKVNLEIARATLTQEMLEYTRQHLDLIKDSGFDSRDIDIVVEAFFAIFVKELKAIRQGLESQSNGRERYELYEEYEIALENAAKVKDRIDKFEGCSYIKKEVEEIISIPTKQIKKDLNIAIDKVIKIRDEISNYANFLIEKWNEEVKSYLDLSLAEAIRDKFEGNEDKLRGLKDAVSEAIDIAKKGKKIFKKMYRLCCDDEGSKQVKIDVEWLDDQRKELGNVVAPLEERINRNLTTMRGDY